MDRRVKPGDDDSVCSTDCGKPAIPAFARLHPLKSLANKKSIPGLESAPILIALCSSEGAVMRRSDGGARCGACGWSSQDQLREARVTVRPDYAGLPLN